MLCAIMDSDSVSTTARSGGLSSRRKNGRSHNHLFLKEHDMAKKVAKKIVKIYRLPVYEHALENVLNMFMPDEQKHFEECESEHEREHHIYLSLLKLENIRRQKYEAEATAATQKFFNTQAFDAKQIASYKRKSRRLQNLTNAEWRVKNANRHGLILLECMECQNLCELEAADKDDYAFWLKTGTVPAGECCLCHGKERAVTCIPLL